jgi:hypothetical protein
VTRACTPADRIRNAIVLGVGIAFVLGFAHALSGVGCVLALTAVLILFRKRGASLARSPQVSNTFGDRLAVALPAVAAAAVAWPALVRPLLQGDSLGYHLPNAAAWVHANSLWTTTTWYWWYPGASELFAATLLAVAGPLALGFAGLAALLLLGQRISAWSVATGTPPWVAGAIAALALSSFAIAKQAASLENDVWVAAFFLETLWALRGNVRRLVTSVATTALLKPTGWIYAGLALAVNRARWPLVVAAFVPLGLWLARDAILAPHAVIAPGTVTYGHALSTTILAHEWIGFVTLAQALAHDGLATSLLFVAGLASIGLGSDRRLRIAAGAALLVFVIHPFGFSDANPQLATGESLRYAAPFLALGALFAGDLARRAPLAIGAAALLVAGFDIARVVEVFSADVTTRGTAAVALVTGAVVLLPVARAWVRASAAATAAAALVAYAVVLAGSHPLDYYEDWLDRGTHHSTFFHWLARNRPAAIVGYGLRVGAIVAVSPQTDAIDPVIADPCAQARRLGALLVASDDVAVPDAPPGGPRRLALACGPIVFDDGTTLVVRPKP